MASDRPSPPGGQPPDLPFLDRLARRLNADHPRPPRPEYEEPPPRMSRLRLPIEHWRLLAATVYGVVVIAMVVGLWFGSQPKPVAILQGHTAPVRGLAFSRDCSLLGSGSDDGTLRVWDLSSGHARLTIQHNGPVECVVFCPGADFVATSAGGFVSFLDPATGEEVGSVAPGTGRIAFSPDGKTLASDTHSKILSLYDVASRQVRLRLLDRQQLVCGVAFSPDGKTLAVGSYDCSL